MRLMVDSKELIKRIRAIPFLSESAMTLISVMGDREHNVADVTRVVECDPILTAKVLNVVNSAAFAISNNIDSIMRAISLLGDKTVVGIAMGLCAENVFFEDLEGYASAGGELWKHCLKCAIASREIANYSKEVVSPDLAYTAGLLHDIGKSIMSDYLKGSTEIIINDINTIENRSYIEEEKYLVGTDHSEVGVLLSAHWNLPLVLRSVIRHHHLPAVAPDEYKSLTYVVHLGDMIAMMEGAGTGMDSMRYSLDNGYTDFIELSPTAFEKIMFKVSVEFEKTASALGGTSDGGES